MRFITKSQEETEDLGRKLASQYAVKGSIFLLEGSLGTGKTAFARGFIRELVGDSALAVPSPTFVISYTYTAKNGDEIRHLDLYRLKDPEESYELDIDYAFENCITLIEWSEVIEKIIPSGSLTINFNRISDNEREINVGDTN